MQTASQVNSKISSKPFAEGTVPAIDAALPRCISMAQFLDAQFSVPIGEKIHEELYVARMVQPVC